MSPGDPGWLSGLNPQQREIVEQPDGPQLVLAGAGSGKTRVVTYRIAFLLRERRLLPGRILALTFTNKAAGEMRARVQALLGLEGRNWWLGTFHALFCRMLRHEGKVVGCKSTFTIYDEDDQTRLVKHILDEWALSPQTYLPKRLLGYISRRKMGLQAAPAGQGGPPNDYALTAERVLEAYQRKCTHANAVDFDDLLLKPLEILRQFPAIREQWQSKFKYILVDEFQDTNRVQYELLKILTDGHQNLTAVGDDDQSIYRWRGAEITNILDFERDFPGTRIFRLEQNYRSTKYILAAASSVVHQNTRRHSKTLWTNREPGEKPRLVVLPEEGSEARWVAATIREEVLRRKRRLGQHAVLFRTNAQSRVLEEGMRAAGLPYLLVGGVRFYERKEVKDVLAYLRVIASPEDEVNLLRIINYPTRGIGPTTLERLHALRAQLQCSLYDALRHAAQASDLSDRVRSSLDGFHRLIEKYRRSRREFSLREWTRTLVEELGILQRLKDEGTVQADGRRENVEELLSAISTFVEKEPDGTLEGFLDQVALVTDLDNWDRSSDAITLMTLHSAKGLEFPTVFITGLEEGLFPLSGAFDNVDALEEERRLFYVGATRAQDTLYLTRTESRMVYGSRLTARPSRFLGEIDPACLERIDLVRDAPAEARPADRPDRRPTASRAEAGPGRGLAVGCWVHHRQFGRGRITQVEGEREKQRVQVVFESGEIRRLMVAFAGLNLLDG